MTKKRKTARQQRLERRTPDSLSAQIAAQVARARQRKRTPKEEKPL